MRAFALSLLVLCLSGPALAQTPAPVPAASAEDFEPIIVTSGTDPVVAALLAAAERYRGQVVLQQCRVQWTERDLKGRKPDEVNRQQQRMVLDESGSPRWQLVSFERDGKPVDAEDFKRSSERLARLDRTPEDEQGYAILAEVLKEPIERLGEEGGYLVYRLQRLPKRLRDDLPSGLADKLQPIIWVADYDTDKPWVRRIHVGFERHRFYLIASARDVKLRADFKRLDDGRMVLSDFAASGEGGFVLGRRIGFEAERVCSEFGATHARATDAKRRRR
jgi:hypothetical protein